jgi:uncharacterized phage protein gp47/JayE
MVDQSINYTPMTYEEIFYALLLDSYNKGFLSDDTHFLEYVNGSMDTENVIILRLSAYSRRLEALWNDLDTNMSLNNPNLAVGEDLVNLCSPFIGEKIPASPAIVVETFNADPAPADNIEIPAGTIIGNEEDPTIQFKTLTTGTLLAGTTSLELDMICTENGPIGKVGPGTLTELIDYIPGITSVTNAEASSGGADEETDKAYLTRFLRWRYSQKRGTREGIEEVISNIPAITDYHIEPYEPDGYGSSQITINPPTQALIDALTVALEDWKAVDENIVVVGVEEVQVDVNVSIDITLDESVGYTVEEKANLDNLITDAIKKYINGLGISKDFIPYLCGVYLSNSFTQIKNISFTSPAEPVTIAADEKAVAGTVEVTVA